MSSRGSVKIGETIIPIIEITFGNGGTFYIKAEDMGPFREDSGNTQIFGPDGTLIATSPGISKIPKTSRFGVLTIYTGIHISPDDVIIGEVVQASIDNSLKSIESGDQ